jgi:hypothetical protein
MVPIPKRVFTQELIPTCLRGSDVVSELQSEQVLPRQGTYPFHFPLLISSGSYFYVAHYVLWQDSFKV